jgi:sugar lactone lactonase YvrE
MTVEPGKKGTACVGEVPDELLWVDMLGQKLHRGALAGVAPLDRVETSSIDHHIRRRRPRGKRRIRTRCRPGLPFIDDSGSIHELAQPEANLPEARMNDGASDAIVRR